MVEEKIDRKTYNAGLIIEFTGSFEQAIIVADEFRFSNGKKVLNYKIPGGMGKSPEGQEEWIFELSCLAKEFGFSEEEIGRISSLERGRKNRLSQEKKGVIREVMEEVGLYVLELEHLHYQLSPGNLSKGYPEADQNFFFVKKYAAPINPLPIFKSQDSDVKRIMKVYTEELLDETPNSPARTIVRTHRQALVEKTKKFPGVYSKKVTL